MVPPLEKDPSLDLNKSWHEVIEDVPVSVDAAYYHEGEEDAEAPWKPPKPGTFPIHSPDIKHANVYAEHIRTETGRREEFESLPKWKQDLTRANESKCLEYLKEYDQLMVNRLGRITRAPPPVLQRLKKAKAQDQFDVVPVDVALKTRAYSTSIS